MKQAHGALSEAMYDVGNLCVIFSVFLVFDNFIKGETRHITILWY